MFDEDSSRALEIFLVVARLYAADEREALRLAECAFQRVCADPDLLDDNDGLSQLVSETALWPEREIVPPG